MIGTVIVTGVYTNTTNLGHAYGVCVVSSSVSTADYSLELVLNSNPATPTMCRY